MTNKTKTNNFFGEGKVLPEERATYFTIEKVKIWAIIWITGRLKLMAIISLGYKSWRSSVHGVG